ncbi:hypothetical protein BS17DRAFT_774777 [Gyrodon lividus]|nr:hypothetical protein BS17DRAFT_774777 [Gyrodon lividus]
MHPCLFIPELTLQIIAYLADDCSTEEHATTSRSPKNARDVARLARTCKTLSEPTLDVLWKTQHSLVPLVMCLPSDAWNQGGTGKTIVSTHIHTHQYASGVHSARHSCYFPMSKIHVRAHVKLPVLGERHYTARLGVHHEIRAPHPSHISPQVVRPPKARRHRPGRPPRPDHIRRTVSSPPHT